LWNFSHILNLTAFRYDWHRRRHCARFPLAHLLESGLCAPARETAVVNHAPNVKLPGVMDAADFRRIALSLDGAEENSHMGSPDFRVNGRIFATLASLHLGYGNLKLTRNSKLSLSMRCPMYSCRLPADGGRRA